MPLSFLNIDTDYWLDIAQNNLTRAFQDKQKYKKLRERKLASYQKEFDTFQQKELDEFTLQAGFRQTFISGNFLSEEPGRP